MSALRKLYRRIGRFYFNHAVALRNTFHRLIPYDLAIFSFLLSTTTLNMVFSILCFLDKLDIYPLMRKENGDVNPYLLRSNLGSWIIIRSAWSVRKLVKRVEDMMIWQHNHHNLRRRRLTRGQVEKERSRLLPGTEEDEITLSEDELI